MGWKPKADDEHDASAPRPADATPAPGKTTRSERLPTAKKGPEPGRGPSIATLNVSREPDDPFGLHLLDNAELGLPPRGLPGTDDGRRGRLAREEYLVWLDYEQLLPAASDLRDGHEYAQRVTATWGSLDTYLQWRHEADRLLDKPLPAGGTVRRLINERGETQRVFFFWVAWEYRQRGLDDAAIIALFDAQVVDQLRDAIVAAEAKLGAPIPTQGFCPRPQRNARGYVMGTLSEHGLGRAVDIEPDKNPIIQGDLWKKMEALVGRKIDRSRRRWEDQPDELYDDLVAFSLAWAAIVTEHVETARRAPGRAASFARQHPGTLVDYGSLGTPDPTAHPLLDQVPTVDEQHLPTDTIARLLRITRAEAGALATLPGYEVIGHPRRRVLALREQGLVWGATFPNVDLHHFEVASPPLAPWSIDEHRHAPRRTDAGFGDNLEPY